MNSFAFSDIATNYLERIDPVPGDEKRYVGLEHLTSDSLYISKWGSDTELKGQKIKMSKGDVLFAKRNAYLKRVGIAPFDGIFSAHGLILRPNEDVISKKLFPFFIKSDIFMDRAIQISVGSLSPTINWSDLKDEVFEIPDISKHDEYSELLWDLENLLRLYGEQIQLLEYLVKSRFNEMFGNVKNNVHNFKVTNIESCCEILDSKRIPITAKDRKPGPYPYYGANGIQDYVDDYIFDDELVLLAEDGGRFDEIGHVAYSISGKSWVNNHAHILKPLKNIMTIPFLEYSLNSIDFRYETTGSTRQKLTQGAMRKIKILQPPLELQNQFADFVKQVDKSKFVLQKHIENTKNLQKSLINKIFS